MRIPLLAAPLLASVSLAACSSAWKPPEIKYDDTPRPSDPVAVTVPVLITIPPLLS